MSAYGDIVQKAQLEFPKLRIMSYYDNWFFRILIKLGWMMGATAIWNLILMDPKYMGTREGATLLRHELMHIRDQHRWPVLFFISYWILPVGPSFKAYWEWRGYRETLSDEFERTGNISDDSIEWVVGYFWSASYAWMWPFPWMVRKWCRMHRAKLLSGSIKAA